MTRFIHTVKGASGELLHFDESGNYVGVSVPNGFGDTYTTLDAQGMMVGGAMRDTFGDSVLHTDMLGRVVGCTESGIGGDGFTMVNEQNDAFGQSGKWLLDD